MLNSLLSSCLLSTGNIIMVCFSKNFKHRFRIYVELKFSMIEMWNCCKLIKSRSQSRSLLYSAFWFMNKIKTRQCQRWISDDLSFSWAMNLPSLSWPVRWESSLLIFVGLICNYAMRLNISIAILKVDVRMTWINQLFRWLQKALRCGRCKTTLRYLGNLRIAPWSCLLSSMAMSSSRFPLPAVDKGVAKLQTKVPGGRLAEMYGTKKVLGYRFGSTWKYLLQLDFFQHVDDKLAWPPHTLGRLHQHLGHLRSPSGPGHCHCFFIFFYICWNYRCCDQ